MRLRDLPYVARVGIVCLVLVLVGGLAASAAHMYWHYENRDERPGITMDDLTGAYHGIQSPSRLLASLESGHPDGLPDRERDILVAWLNSDRVSADFDDLDLGDDAPAEIMAVHCLECHRRSADDEVARELPLEFWDDVEAIAFSRRINPTPVEVLAASTHAHALSLATMSIVIAVLMLLTSWPGVLRSGLVLLAGAGLLADMGAWWLARDNPGLVWLIVIGGGLYNGATGLMLVAIMLDLLVPGGRKS